MDTYDVNVKSQTTNAFQIQDADGGTKTLIQVFYYGNIDEPVTFVLINEKSYEIEKVIEAITEILNSDEVKDLPDTSPVYDSSFLVSIFAMQKKIAEDQNKSIDDLVYLTKEEMKFLLDKFTRMNSLFDWETKKTKG
jgi:hypothetical protein